MNPHRRKRPGELGYRFERGLGPVAGYLHNIAMQRGWRVVSMGRHPPDTRPGTIVLEFNKE